MKLSDAQWGVLRQIIDFGPVTAKEVVMPPAMDGTCRTKLQCHHMSKATMERLEADGLIHVTRTPEPRPTNAVGKAGHRRNAIMMDITAAGRAVVGL